MTRIKFCGFTRPQDLVFAVNVCGVDAVGFVRDPASPRCVDDWTVGLLSSLCGPMVSPVSVYGSVGAFKPLGTRCVQASDYSLWKYEGEIARILTLPVPIDADTEWKSTQVGRMSEDTLRWSAILLDAHVPGFGGGTGQKIPWHVAADFLEGCRLPVIIAGGLTPDNVAEAIKTVRPYGVDVSSGIESSPGVKDHGKMKAFVEAVRSVE